MLDGVTAAAGSGGRESQRSAWGMLPTPGNARPRVSGDSWDWNAWTCSANVYQASPPQRHRGVVWGAPAWGQCWGPAARSLTAAPQPWAALL